jgi:glycosyltransferase involved in cell wall biosynthesis
MMSIPRPKNPLFSFIIPAYAEEKNIALFLTSLTTILTTLKIKYELVVIDDGSPDNTGAILRELGKTIPLKCLFFSRNFGKEQALTAGLKYASGDAAILIDSDCQHPLDIIETFIKHWTQGYDVVYGIRQDRDGDGYIRRSLTAIFYKLLTLGSNIPIEPNAGDFRLLDRKAIDALNALPERSRFMKGLYAWVGFKSIGIPFKVTQRPAGCSSYTFRKLSSLAIIGLTSFSTFPIRLSMILGIITSCSALSYGSWIIFKTLIYGRDLPGWSTLTVAILFLGGIQLIAIGILGEYIGHIFTEVKKRPQYIIAETYDSKKES